MKNTMLAILAVALAALAPFALAAEGSGDKDDGGVDQPTMRQLANKIDSAVRRLGAVEATVGTLATATAVDALTTEVRTLSSTVSANHTTIVGKFAQQMAVVMAVPTGTGRSNAAYYLIGDSSIAGFPKGTVGTYGGFTDTTLPAGTYLFELQRPYGDNAICQRSVSRRHPPTGGGVRVVGSNCPMMDLITTSASGRQRVDDGNAIYTYAAPATFAIRLKLPSAVVTDDVPLSSYFGAVRITKLK